MLVEDPLDLRGRDVLAHAPQAVLLSAHIAKEPALVERSEIAGTQDAVLERRFSGVRVAPIACAENSRDLFTNPDLADLLGSKRPALVVDDRQVEIGQRLADRSGDAFEILRCEAAALRHAVGIVDLHAE